MLACIMHNYFQPCGRLFSSASFCIPSPLSSRYPGFSCQNRVWGRLFVVRYSPQLSPRFAALDKATVFRYRSLVGA